MFKKFDEDGDGELVKDEVALMAPMDPDRYCNAEVAVTCADKDKSNSISETEFLKTFGSAEEKDGFQKCYIKFEPMCHGSFDQGPVRRPKKVDIDASLTTEFEKLDKNRDGELTV